MGIEGPIVDQQVEEERPWHSCVIQFSLDLVSLFSLIYIVVCSTPTTTIFSIYFLMQPSGGGKQNEERVVFGSTSGQCRLESRRKKNRISQPARSTLLATLACACACAPPPAVSRNKKVSQDKIKMGSVSLSIELVWKGPFNRVPRASCRK